MAQVVNNLKEAKEWFLKNREGKVRCGKFIRSYPGGPYNSETSKMLGTYKEAKEFYGEKVPRSVVLDKHNSRKCVVLCSVLVIGFTLTMGIPNFGGIMLGFRIAAAVLVTVSVATILLGEYEKDGVE